MSRPAPDWWQTFFQGVTVDMWLQAVPEAATRQEVDFVVQALGVAPPARLLDVPCGGGRHAVALAERGFHVTGIDLSADFLRAAMAKSQGRDLPISWQQGDMRDLPDQVPFDGALCMGNSFGYLDDAGNASFLKAVSRALQPGARLIIDTGMLSESFLHNFKERFWYEIGDILFLLRNQHNLQASRLETDMIFVRGGQVDRRAISHRIYTYRELLDLLGSAGFPDVQAFASVAGEPYVAGSPQALLVARRA